MATMKVRVGRFNFPDGSIREDAGQVIELRNGRRVGGLAPIGIPWAATVRNGKLVPDKGCPASEFVLTHIVVDGAVVPVDIVQETGNGKRETGNEERR